MSCTALEDIVEVNHDHRSNDSYTIEEIEGRIQKVKREVVVDRCTIALHFLFLGLRVCVPPPPTPVAPCATTT